MILGILRTLRILRILGILRILRSLRIRRGIEWRGAAMLSVASELHPPWNTKRCGARQGKAPTHWELHGYDALLEVPQRAVNHILSRSSNPGAGGRTLAPETCDWTRCHKELHPSPHGARPNRARPNLLPTEPEPMPCTRIPCASRGSRSGRGAMRDKRNNRRSLRMEALPKPGDARGARRARQHLRAPLFAERAATMYLLGGVIWPDSDATRCAGMSTQHARRNLGHVQ